MESSYASLSNKIAKLDGRRELLREQLISAEIKFKTDSLHMENALKARAITQTVASATQSKIEFHISNLVSMALAAVFPDPYEFKLKYELRRGKTEADLIFIKRGNDTDDILNSGGGGVADIASLALRISAWSLKKNRPTLLLDEPTKFLHSPIYQAKASLLLKELSEKIGLQIIMITDQKAMVEAADQSINMVNNNGVATAE